MQSDLHEAPIYVDAVGILDIAELSEATKEEIYPGPRATDHRSQSLLTDGWQKRFRSSLSGEIGYQK